MSAQSLYRDGIEEEKQNEMFHREKLMSYVGMKAASSSQIILDTDVKTRLAKNISSVTLNPGASQSSRQRMSRTKKILEQKTLQNQRLRSDTYSTDDDSVVSIEDGTLDRDLQNRMTESLPKESQRIENDKDKNNSRKGLICVVISIVIVIVVILLLGDIFIFGSSSASNELQSEIEKLRNMIITKLPQSADDLNSIDSLRYKIIQSMAEKKVENPEFYTDKRLINQYSLRTFFGSALYESENSTSPDECAWEFVGCNGENIIMKIEGVLWGTLPPEIALLPLEILSLKNNFLTGTIPTEIGLLRQLRHLTITGNLFSGTIPSEIALIPLKEIVFSKNRFTGTIPSEIGLMSMLGKLALGNNNLSGSIPSELGQLNSIKHLSLHGNSFTGSIPSEIFRQVQIDANIFSHESEVGLLDLEVPPLEVLSLSMNFLTGTIPTEIGLSRKLRKLLVSTNRLSGTIPSEIGLSNVLEEIYLQRNILSGSIPSEIGLLKRLEQLNLTNNNKSGRIPSEIGQLLSAKEISFGTNLLTGSIPSEIGLMDQLVAFIINGNEISGSIPSEIGLLQRLTLLYFESNQFTGKIPPEINHLETLTNLNLWNNNALYGSIPDYLCEANIGNNIFYVVPVNVSCTCCDDML